MRLLSQYAPRQEVYSIDEAFLDLTGICDNNPVAYGQTIKTAIVKQTGIPVCVGIAPTKILAKLANYAAKRWKKTGGVVDLSCPDRRKNLMQQVPVNDIWGIGARTTHKLKQLGVQNAWQLARLNNSIIKAEFSVLLAKTVMELNATPCLALEQNTPDKQQIVCSRSFKQRLLTCDQLANALIRYASRAMEKLRKQHSTTALVTISIRTGLFDPSKQQYQRTISLSLAHATQDTSLIIKTAKSLLQQIFKAGYRYQHAGITLGLIQSQQTSIQNDMFAIPSSGIKPVKTELAQQALMASVDKINQRFPRAIAFSSTLFKQHWQYESKYRSPRYTTHWEDLRRVKCE